MFKKVMIDTFEDASRSIRCNAKYQGGHLPKDFFWVNDNTMSNSSKYFGKVVTSSVGFAELIHALQNNEHYQVYFRNAICRKKTKDMVIPRHILCLVKEVKDNNKIPADCYACNEIVGSKLANLVGVNTAYNSYYQDGDNRYVLSVNCTPCGGKQFTMGDMGIYMGLNDSLQMIFRDIDEKLPRFAERNHLDITLNRVEMYKEELAKLWLFRRILCDDSDFGDHNVISFITPNNSIAMGPCIDMEYLLFSSTDIGWRDSTGQYCTALADNFTFLCKSMGYIVRDFVNTVNEKFASGEIEKMLDSQNQNLVGPRKDDIMRYITKNISNMNELYNTYQQSRNKGRDR